MTSPWEDEELCTWVQTPEFQDRCCKLFERFDNGELLTAQVAADFVGLPFEIFRDGFTAELVIQEMRAQREKNKKLN